MLDVLLQRRVGAWGYLEREDDLLVRRGLMVRRLSVVPYGRMQFVDVTAGPVERSFGLATVRLHTAAAASDARIPGLEAAEAARLRDQLAGARRGARGRAVSTWHRLHPLSPAVRAGRGLIAIAVIFLPTLVSGGTNSWDVAWHFIAVGALVVLGVVSWLVTRWQIDGNDLRIETGLLRRSSLRYPLSQVQAIDTVRPGLARALGLAELRLRMGGTGGAARLAYLPVVQANALRARLLALSQGAHEETPEPIDHELVRVPPARVAVSLLLSGPTVVLVVYFVALAAASSAGKHGLRGGHIARS